jgi:hypothetical protein
MSIYAITKLINEIPGWDTTCDTAFTLKVETFAEGDFFVIENTELSGQLRKPCPEESIALDFLRMIPIETESISLATLEFMGFEKYNFKQKLKFNKTRIKVEIVVNVSMTGHEIQADEIEDVINDSIEDNISNAINSAESAIEDTIVQRLDDEGIDASDVSVSVGIDRYDC